MAIYQVNNEKNAHRKWHCLLLQYKWISRIQLSRCHWFHVNYNAIRCGTKQENRSVKFVGCSSITDGEPNVDRIFMRKSWVMLLEQIVNYCQLLCFFDDREWEWSFCMFIFNCRKLTQPNSYKSTVDDAKFTWIRPLRQPARVLQSCKWYLTLSSKIDASIWRAIQHFVYFVVVYFAFRLLTSMLV